MNIAQTGACLLEFCQRITCKDAFVAAEFRDYLALRNDRKITIFTVSSLLNASNAMLQASSGQAVSINLIGQATCVHYPQLTTRC